jgi:hypothetical protein
MDFIQDLQQRKVNVITVLYVTNRDLTGQTCYRYLMQGSGTVISD